MSKQLSKLVARYFLLDPWIPPRFKWGWLDDATLIRRLRDHYVPDHYWWIEIMSHRRLLDLASSGGPYSPPLNGWYVDGLHTYDLKEVFHHDLLAAQAICLNKINDMPLPPPSDWEKEGASSSYERFHYPLPATLAGFSDDSRPDSGYPESQNPLPSPSTACSDSCSPELSLAATPESNQSQSSEKKRLVVKIGYKDSFYVGHDGKTVVIPENCTNLFGCLLTSLLKNIPGVSDYRTLNESLLTSSKRGTEAVSSTSASERLRKALHRLNKRLATKLGSVPSGGSWIITEPKIGSRLNPDVYWHVTNGVRTMFQTNRRRRGGPKSYSTDAQLMGRITADGTDHNDNHPEYDDD